MTVARGAIVRHPYYGQNLIVVRVANHMATVAYLGDDTEWCRLALRDVATDQLEVLVLADGTRGGSALFTPPCQATGSVVSAPAA